MRHLLLASLACGFFAGSVHAQQTFDFQRDCADWLAQKGYSGDFIQLKTGKRQPGMPKNWRGNVDAKDVQPGDVVITFIQRKGQNQRVAYVEEVRRNADGSAGAVFVSEWNQGKYTDERCFVTDHFGRLSESKPIPVDTIARVWRPSLPLPARQAAE